MNKTKTLDYLTLLDNRIKKVFIKLDGYLPRKLEYKPYPKEWNTLQVIEHLRMSEFLSIRYLKYKNENGYDSLADVGIKEKFNVFVLKQRMASSKKIKAPDSPGLSPEAEGLIYGNIKSSWRENRIEMRSIFENHNDEMFSKNLYKHPSIGRINLYQMLQFFEGHIERHIKQINKLLDDEKNV